MEMHDLQQAWNQLDERVREQQDVLLRLERRTVLTGIRARLRVLALGPVVQLAIGVLIALWAGGYWTAHLDQAHLVVCGVAIHLYGLGLAIAAGLQLAALLRVDYHAPVLEVQRRLLALRRVRIAGERVMLIAGFVAWLPLLIVALRGAGLDLWLAHPGNVLANLAVALGLAALVGGLVHRFRARFEHDAAGRRLREAEAELAELAGPPVDE